MSGSGQSVFTVKKGLEQYMNRLSLSRDVAEARAAALASFVDGGLSVDRIG